jgi:hypothetical protein
MCILLRDLDVARDLRWKYARMTRLPTLSVHAIFCGHIAADDAIVVPVSESYRSLHCTCIAPPTLSRYYEPHHGQWRPLDLIASEARRGGYASRRIPSMALIRGGTLSNKSCESILRPRTPATHQKRITGPAPFQRFSCSQKPSPKM